MKLPFHPLTDKKVGDRVKIPRFPLDESKGFHFGTVTGINLKIAGLQERIGVSVQWDDVVKYVECIAMYPSVPILAA